jgi:dihydroorotate dehydrogenase (fumarate)
MSMDLSTTYLGLKLPHPFVAGASPLADSVDGARRLEDSGAAALVMRSLFEEQLDAEALATFESTEQHAGAHGEAQTYFADPAGFVVGPDEYLERLRSLKNAVQIPVIASLNGCTLGGWTRFASFLQDAGADALELNIYQIPTDGSDSAGDVEDRTVDVVREVRSRLKIPMSVKLSPFYTSLPHLADRLREAGADGLVLFNRFFEADVDTEELEILSELVLSHPRELLLRLRWLAILSSLKNAPDLAVSGGVHEAQDRCRWSRHCCVTAPSGCGRSRPRCRRGWTSAAIRRWIRCAAA